VITWPEILFRNVPCFQWCSNVSAVALNVVSAVCFNTPRRYECRVAPDLTISHPTGARPGQIRNSYSAGSGFGEN